MRRLLALMALVGALSLAAGCSNGPSPSPGKSNPTPDTKGNEAKTGMRKIGDPQ
jgi:hypothetical protein